MPVKVRNSHIGNSYNDLFNALPYNSRIKKFILAFNKHSMKSRKGYTSAEELYETMLEDSFIEDLIQSKPDPRGNGDKNVLDILLDMRNGMEPDAWNGLFVGLREVLWEYCAFMFDQNERMVNTTVRSILDKMLANSSVGSKEDLNYGERELKTMVEGIRSIAYKRN